MAKSKTNYIAIGVTTILLITAIGVKFYSDSNKKETEAPHTFGGNQSAVEPDSIKLPPLSSPDQSKAIHQMTLLNFQLEAMTDKQNEQNEKIQALRVELRKVKENQKNIPPKDRPANSSTLQGLEKAFIDVKQRLIKVEEQTEDNPHLVEDGEYPSNNTANPYGVPQTSNTPPISPSDPNQYDPEWIQPIDAEFQLNEKGDRERIIPDFKKPLTRIYEPAEQYIDTEVPTPHITIPPTTTLVGAVTQSAILAKVPIGGTVTSPYEFLVKLGPEALVSKNNHINGLSNILASGTAIGNQVLECAEGNINKLVFIFEDGVTTTVEADDPEEGRLGYITDEYGIPCISADAYVSNLPQYLTTQMLLQLGKGASDGFGQAQTTQSSNISDSSSKVTGSHNSYAIANGASEGINSVINTLNLRQAGMLDIAYVAVGKVVDIRITEQINIDYPLNTRRLNHDNNYNNVDSFE
ncbi:hypothetical protein [uncultured Shewanella sp.]|uniref:hypothetical protein n=1 Tax=uncultured Shewanella sp. TaxID=173975 RepID=UPI00262FC47E|nr:hypothetical protein [uncultured Shewanella sp.]